MERLTLTSNVVGFVSKDLVTSTRVSMDQVDKTESGNMSLSENYGGPFHSLRLSIMTMTLDKFKKFSFRYFQKSEPVLSLETIKRILDLYVLATLKRSEDPVDIFHHNVILISGTYKSFILNTLTSKN